MLTVIGMFVGNAAPTDGTDPTNDDVIKFSTTAAASKTTCHVIWAWAWTWPWSYAVIAGSYANFCGMYHALAMPFNESLCH